MVYMSIIAIYLVFNFYLFMVSVNETFSSLRDRINTSFYLNILL